MVAAYHLIWTAYGWWLPNDPRGSMSKEISVRSLRELGPCHHGRKTVQPQGRAIREFYERAAEKLRHELLTFPPNQCGCIAEAMGKAIRRHGYTCCAAAVMPDHVHVLIRKHRDRGETMIANLQAASRELLLRRGHRDKEHPVWGGPGWVVFLETPTDIRRVIHYIERNPIKIGWPVQQWEWVTEYDGWLSGLSPHRSDLRNRKRPR
ncbi:hypothetical protein LzC2_38830 [Planctomycetes bacterium LzC2]|uniref:Transposase IS200-like domain-containing protein n=2 Tax=Alienimonas chondri TaxID=2681879 RepID=A0ABX1VI69_9PLAN|nr:hypothetical protein [Alienimonas chondri]